MNKVENIIRCCNRNDDVFRTYIICLLQLKSHNEEFNKVCQELRADYLVRGICEREVDKIIKESKEYETYYLPKVLRWDFLRENPLIIENVCMTLFAYRRLDLSYEEWENVIRCMENNELPL
ncbi:group-specific protein [Bacillus manliponensis]|uniref:group-specific protein n=1 Tax=Bacillus manliponensis TaxID=574376 RepID=UPI0035189E7F